VIVTWYDITDVVDQAEGPIRIQQGRIGAMTWLQE